MSVFEFELADDKNSLLLVLKPGGEGVPDLQAVRESFLASGYGRFLLLDEAVENALSGWNRKLSDDPAAVVEPVAVVIAQRRDAELSMEIADDKLSATAAVTAPYDGKNLTTMDLIVGARKAGINSGLLMHNIADLVQKARVAAPGESLLEVIAQGKPPRDGTDARLEQLAPTLKERILKPREREDGTVDMRDLGAILAVQPNEHLMRRHPPRPGENGLAVTGESIAFEPGKDLELIPGEGAQFAPDDADLLIASRQGLPRRVKDGMGVDEVLVLDTVDLSTGNIEFEGCIVVGGNVAEEMEVHAGGDVSIGGVVESALVEAEGDVIVGEGVIGRQTGEDAAGMPEYSARIRAGGDIHAKYGQSADLRSGRCVRVAEYLFHSRVEARDSIWVGGDKRADGRLVGGVLVAGASVQAGVIGTQAGTRAQFNLSAGIADSQARLEAIKERLKQDIVLENSLSGELERLRPMGAEQEPRRRRVAEVLEECRQRLEEGRTAFKAVHEEKEALLKAVCVVATKRLFPGIRVTLMDENLVTAREHGPCRVVLKETELKIEPLV